MTSKRQNETSGLKLIMIFFLQPGEKPSIIPSGLNPLRHLRFFTRESLVLFFHKTLFEYLIVN
jgi:hypothetical protein